MADPNHLLFASNEINPQLQEGARFTFTGRISAKRKAPDAVVFDEGIASAISEEKNTADGRLAAGRKLTEKVNMAQEGITSSPLSAEAVTLKNRKFPKSARILTNSHYKFLQRNSARYQGDTIQINYRQGRSSTAKLGITVSKKFGKAHDRNRFKRVVREAFRELLPFLPPDLEINVSPRNKGIPLSKGAMLLELQNLALKFDRS